MGERRRVAVVTGGGGGIGAAIAEELGRSGAFVVTMDPLVSLDGSEQLPAPEETTAGRIEAAGGAARASSVSVTDRDGVRTLFGSLVDEFGGLDAVVNVAGITRPTSFAKGSEDDWRAVLEVHLDGYRSILDAALPIMAEAGSGHVLGVTSGSGWRPADAGAYGCAKRAVASLTWQLGRSAPPGVVVNAMSPIAATRMVAAALGRVRSTEKAKPSKTGGLSLASMPTPESLGPLGAHLVDAAFSTCAGRVIFAGGSEIAVIDEPRLLEVVRVDDGSSLAGLLEAVSGGALARAEAEQATTGGSNSRFGSVFDDPGSVEVPPTAVRTCGIVTDRAEVESALTAALEQRGVACHRVEVGDRGGGFDAAADALSSAVERAGELDAVVVALAGAPSAAAAEGWNGLLAEHEHIVDQLHTDAGWTRAVTDYAADADRPIRLLTLTDATSTGGRTRGQAIAQLARSARRATDDRLAAFTVSVEVEWARGAHSVSELAAHLLCSPDAPALSGAELVAGDGWFGLRSHPRAIGSISFGGPEIPEWFDDVLGRVVGADGRS